MSYYKRGPQIARKFIPKFLCPIRNDTVYNCVCVEDNRHHLISNLSLILHYTLLRLQPTVANKNGFSLPLTAPSGSDPLVMMTPDNISIIKKLNWHQVIPPPLPLASFDEFVQEDIAAQQ